MSQNVTSKNAQTAALKKSTKEVDGRLARGGKTRAALLESAFDEIYEHGFQSASLANILRAADCTKGSLYHHFPDKHALGIAAAQAKINEHFEKMWFASLAATQDPLTTIINCIQRYMDEGDARLIRLGCPVQNLSQEMSPIDEEFRLLLAELIANWHNALASALRRGVENNTVSQTANIDEIAALVITSHQGNIGVLKATRDLDLARNTMAALFSYLNNQRPASA
ncbi:MAG: TetR/AcrR family transcriptional regulator [Parvibaculaceae bacterium]|nr:TetR/AcrR family transcriptional regulator [Parvibaculaceae bacterium]